MSQVPIVQFRLTGWKAVAAGVFLVVLLGWRVVSARSALSEDLTEQLQQRLGAEYAGAALQGFDAAKIHRGGGDVDAGVQKVLDSLDVEIVSIRAKGRDPAVIRVEFLVAGKEAPDGESVRYYEARHSLALGWRIVRERTALSYYLKLL